MYKRLSLDTMLQVQNSFFDRLLELCKKKNHQFLKWFLQEFVSESERVYFFRDNKVQFCFTAREDGWITITDEYEHLELVLSIEETDRLHNLLKDKRTMIQASKQQSVFEELIREFSLDTTINHFEGKPFLVYDIETSFDGRGGEQQFAIAYALDSAKDHSAWLHYDYIPLEWLHDFAQKLLNYDGWIVGFNHISFDNPITILQAWYTQEELIQVQQKSLDPFQLIWFLTGKRMGLQVMATALLGAWKTLSSWAEWQSLRDKWIEKGDEKALEKFKEYCKNDVAITLGVRLYLIRYQEIQLDGEQLTIDNATRHKNARYKTERSDQETQSGLW